MICWPQTLVDHWVKILQSAGAITLGVALEEHHLGFRSSLRSGVSRHIISGEKVWAKNKVCTMQNTLFQPFPLRRQVMPAFALGTRLRILNLTAHTACPHRVSEQKFRHEAASRLKSLTGNSRLNNIYH